ncbi:hypothetical protein GCM10009122_44880 [Fulvivirga kasyanovii]|uniref:Uncharacterized protein n=1 Tax=Fulvivirga kasyanovii TaxID=396812 RepID=A0ABW9RLI4_9BACT|nr:hypothetical protein [Fulvivirga kasyanovii]MTI24551.1 hypothetical protein [Fulvivirga kasyanovii]
MLSEEEKNKIRAEEMYRVEVRQQLEEDKSGKKKGGKLLSFLNSNFGSFLLSTVIVGSISVLYSNHQEKMKKIEAEKLQAHANLLIQDKLQTELSHRLNTISTITDTLPDYQSKDIYLAYHGSSIANDPLIKAQFFNFKSHYIEYSNWSAIRLVSELQKYNDSPHLKKLKLLLNDINASIVDYGQEWFYVTATEVLPKRIKIRKMELSDGRKLHVYNIGNGDHIMSKEEYPFKKVWHMAESKALFELQNVIKELNF